MTEAFDAPVDPTNPGQYLACGGLLCLADAIHPGSLGWFSENRFHLEGPESFRDRLPGLSFRCLGVNPDRPAPIGAVDAARDRSKAAPKGSDARKLAQQEVRDLQNAALEVRLDDRPLLVLDWWLEAGMQDAGFKTWSGGQVAAPHMEQMAARAAEPDPADAWAALEIGPADGKPFYFDSRLSRLTSLDLGFSSEKFHAAFSPAVELLAMIGLQRFRPRTLERRAWYAYGLWSQPLPLPLAALAASTLAPTLSDRAFRFPLVRRTGGKYKALGPAEPVSFSPAPPDDHDA